MKKVLIISGSPRKGGNSDSICDEFAKGVIEGGSQVEKVCLREKKIGFCTACDYCVTHKGICAFKDDCAEILEKMVQADVLVLSSPVYFYSIDAQLKALIDRSVARYTQMRDKEMYFILTAAETSMEAFEGSLGCMRGFLDCLPEAEEKGVIIGEGVWKIGEIKNHKALKQAYEAGKKV